MLLRNHEEEKTHVQQFLKSLRVRGPSRSNPGHSRVDCVYFESSRRFSEAVFWVYFIFLQQQPYLHHVLALMGKKRESRSTDKKGKFHILHFSKAYL